MKGPPQRIDAVAYLFNAAGRSGRTAGLVAIVVVTVIVQTVQVIPGGWLHDLCGWILGFVAFVIWATVMARRLHDLGRAGWWIAPHFALACLASLTAPQAPWLATGVGLVAIAIQVALLLWPGQPGFNRFGPKPA